MPFRKVKGVQIQMTNDIASRHHTSEFCKVLFNNPLMNIFYMDLDGVISQVNDAFSHLLGYTYDDIVSQPLSAFLVSKEDSRYDTSLQKVFQNEALDDEYQLLKRDGTVADIHLSLIPLTEKGELTAIFGMARDITASKQAEREHLDAELKFWNLIGQSPAGFYIIQDEQFIYVNNRMSEILSTDIDTNRSIWDFLHPENHYPIKQLMDSLKEKGDSARQVYAFRRSKGNDPLQVEIYVMLSEYKGKPTLFGSVNDITEWKKTEKLNQYLSYHDLMTELPNRKFFEERLKEEMGRQENKIGILYFDIDRFKQINDSLGHTIGDQFIVQITKRLQKTFPHQMVARLGGDEFAVLLPGLRDHEALIAKTKLAMEAFERVFEVDEHRSFITSTIGGSMYPDDGQTAEALIQHAHSALHRAKSTDKSSFHMYAANMDAQTLRSFQLQNDMHTAIQDHEFELYYQPKVCTAQEEIVGIEALIRWNHPKFGLLTPNEFLPIAEETGHILAIDRWVLKEACRQNKAWQDKGYARIPVSINLTAGHFMKVNLAKIIAAVLEDTGLHSCYLEVEITETSLLEEEHRIINSLDALRELGVRISLDDFGTGYSSLSYLKRFKGRIDTLKLDRSFIKDLQAAEPMEGYITEMVIQLANRLQMNIVAEGVETMEQKEILHRFNCYTIQGFLYSRPVTAEVFEGLLKQVTLPATENS